MTPPGRPMSKLQPTENLGTRASRRAGNPDANATQAFVAPIFRRPATSGRVLKNSVPWPHRLVPFVESHDFALLAEALRQQPRLYSHPAVQEQIGHLLRLRDDEDAWFELWDVHVDPIHGVATPPEVERVEEILEQLLNAHVDAVLPNKAIISKHVPKKPGEKGGFENPHPIDDDATWISPGKLHASWRRLREGFESPSAERLLRAMLLQPPAEHLHEVVALAHEVIDDDPPLWSALIKRVATAEPPCGLSNDERQFWMEYRQPFELRTTVDLEHVVMKALRDLRQRTPRLRVSPAAYLASALLAAHLTDATPMQVHRAVEHYQRTRRP